MKKVCLSLLRKSQLVIVASSILPRLMILGALSLLIAGRAALAQDLDGSPGGNAGQLTLSEGCSMTPTFYAYEVPGWGTANYSVGARILSAHDQHQYCEHACRTWGYPDYLKTEGANPVCRCIQFAGCQFGYANQWMPPPPYTPAPAVVFGATAQSACGGHPAGSEKYNACVAQLVREQEEWASVTSGGTTTLNYVGSWRGSFGYKFGHPCASGEAPACTPNYGLSALFPLTSVRTERLADGSLACRAKFSVPDASLLSAPGKPLAVKLTLQDGSVAKKSKTFTQLSRADIGAPYTADLFSGRKLAATISNPQCELNVAGNVKTSGDTCGCPWKLFSYFKGYSKASRFGYIESPEDMTRFRYVTDEHLSLKFAGNSLEDLERIYLPREDGYTPITACIQDAVEVAGTQIAGQVVPRPMFQPYQMKPVLAEYYYLKSQLQQTLDELQSERNVAQTKLQELTAQQKSHPDVTGAADALAAAWQLNEINEGFGSLITNFGTFNGSYWIESAIQAYNQGQPIPAYSHPAAFGRAGFDLFCGGVPGNCTTIGHIATALLRQITANRLASIALVSQSPWLTALWQEKIVKTPAWSSFPTQDALLTAALGKATQTFTLELTQIDATMERLRRFQEYLECPSAANEITQTEFESAMRLLKPPATAPRGEGFALPPAFEAELSGLSSDERKAKLLDIEASYLFWLIGELHDARATVGEATAAIDDTMIALALSASSGTALAAAGLKAGRAVLLRARLTGLQAARSGSTVLGMDGHALLASVRAAEFTGAVKDSVAGLYRAAMFGFNLTQFASGFDDLLNSFTGACDVYIPDYQSPVDRLNSSTFGDEYQLFSECTRQGLWALASAGFAAVEGTALATRIQSAVGLRRVAGREEFSVAYLTAVRNSLCETERGAFDFQGFVNAEVTLQLAREKRGIDDIATSFANVLTKGERIPSGTPNDPLLTWSLRNLGWLQTLQDPYIWVRGGSGFGTAISAAISSGKLPSNGTWFDLLKRPELLSLAPSSARQGKLYILRLDKTMPVGEFGKATTAYSFADVLKHREAIQIDLNINVFAKGSNLIGLDVNPTLAVADYLRTLRGALSHEMHHAHILFSSRYIAWQFRQEAEHRVARKVVQELFGYAQSEVHDASTLERVLGKLKGVDYSEAAYSGNVRVLAARTTLADVRAAYLSIGAADAFSEADAISALRAALRGQGPNYRRLLPNASTLGRDFGRMLDGDPLYLPVGGWNAAAQEAAANWFMQDLRAYWKSVHNVEVEEYRGANATIGAILGVNDRSPATFY